MAGVLWRQTYSKVLPGVFTSMTETKPVYHTNGHGNGTAPSDPLPSQWIRLLYRLAGLERGRIYTITLVVPEKAGSEPQWGIQAAGVLENAKRV